MTLELSSVEKSYGAFCLGPVDLVVEDEVLSVLGPSGCGKTTLLSAIAGLVEPDAGIVTLNGTDLTGRPPETRGTVVVFQDGALFPHMTAHENVAYAASSTERVKGLAEKLEIVGVLDQRADTLSGGERQRVALARSLAADPVALLLDEPLANLDAPIKRRLRDELRPLLSSLSIPVVYVTHDQREATVVGDRLAVMNEGGIQQLDTPKEVFARPATPFVASFTGSTNLFRARVTGTNHRLVLDWNGHAIDAAGDEHEHDIGDEVWFCIRPEYVEIADTIESTETHDADRSNLFDGRIVRRIFAGDEYLIDITPDGVHEEIQVTLSPAVYDRVKLTDRDRVLVSLEREAIHVIAGP